MDGFALRGEFYVFKTLHYNQGGFTIEAVLESHSYNKSGFMIEAQVQLKRNTNLSKITRIQTGM